MIQLIFCTRSLEGIGKRSRILLDERKGARVLDKERYSGLIVRLVEELRQAILIYQVGTVETCQLSRVDALRIAIATEVYERPDCAVGCKSPSQCLYPQS